MRLLKTLTAAFAAVLSTVAAQAGPALLFDASNGKVLYAEDQDHQWHPASLTKIMTAYVTFEALKAGEIRLDSKIPVSEHANLQPPSKVGLPVGAEMTVELALQALIVKSANDVAMMLAEGVGGSEEKFVERMNAAASRLGMTRTRFVNPHGLPAAEQITTARDLAKLSRAVVAHFPEHARYWSMPEFRIGNRRLGTHNVLLKTFEGADGLKTGFICDSGFNVVASATRDGRKLMAVVLGETTGHERALRAASLLEHGFQQYGWKELFNTQTIDNLPVAEDAKGITSMRQTVLSWDCGNRRRVVRSVAKAKKAKANVAAARSKAQEAASAGSAAGGASAVGGGTAPGAAPASNPPAQKAAAQKAAVPASPAAAQPKTQ
jgi:D-alanyl-D-alanine carboxypeptidase